MSYVSTESLEKLMKMLEVGGFKIDREALPCTDDVELGLEREFDCALYSAIEEENEEATMALYGGSIGEDGEYLDIVKEMFGLVSSEIKAGNFKNSYDETNEHEKVDFSIGDEQFSWTFSFDYFDENKLVKSFTSVISGLSSIRVVKVLDEDCTYLMSTPKDAAIYLHENFQIFEIC